MRQFIVGFVVAACLFVAIDAYADKRDIQIQDPLIKAHNEFGAFTVFEHYYYIDTRRQALTQEKKISIVRFLEKCILFSRTEAAAQYFREQIDTVVGGK